MMRKCRQEGGLAALPLPGFILPHLETHASGAGKWVVRRLSECQQADVHPENSTAVTDL